MMLLRTMCSNSMPCWNNIYFPSQLSPTEPYYQPEEARDDTFPAEIGRACRMSWTVNTSGVLGQPR